MLTYPHRLLSFSFVFLHFSLFLCFLFSRMVFGFTRPLPVGFVSFPLFPSDSCLFCLLSVLPVYIWFYPSIFRFSRLIPVFSVWFLIYLSGSPFLHLLPCFLFYPPASFYIRSVLMSGQYSLTVKRRNEALLCRFTFLIKSLYNTKLRSII